MEKTIIMVIVSPEYFPETGIQCQSEEKSQWPLVAY
jgi:hypothetical protein